MQPDTHPSVAIVAMGHSNQAWLRRMYNNNSEFFAHVVHERLKKLFMDRDDLAGLIRGAFADMPEMLDEAAGMAETFSITPEESESLEGFAKHIGEQITTREIGEAYDKVWAINHMGKVLKGVDMIFAMDDLRREKERYNEMLEGDIPIMTSRAYPEFNSLEYPLDAVVEDLGWVYFTNTVIYAIAYAIHKGYKRIGLYGCDFHDPTNVKSEDARANAEFFLGIAHERGVKLEVAEGSTTMNMHKPQALYGYAEQPIIRAHGMEMHYNGNTWNVRSIENGTDEADGGTEA